MLFAERSGSGVPLVFLHAFPLSHRMWDGQKSVFSKNFQFITVDLSGFGQSPLSGDTSAMEDMAKRVVEALDALKIDGKIVAAGLSMGGYVLLQLIKLIPDRLRAVAFLSTRSAPDSPQGREKRFEVIETIKKEGKLEPYADRSVKTLLGTTTQASQPAVVNHVKQMILQGTEAGISAALRGMAARSDTTAVLDSLQIPALFLAGAEDVVIPSSEMEQMSKKVAKSEFHAIANAGHLINLEQPTIFNNLFLHFLKRHVL